MKNLLSQVLKSDVSLPIGGILRGRAQEATERVLRDIFWRSDPAGAGASVVSLAGVRAKRMSRPR
jgi:hypothetical protein